MSEWSERFKASGVWKALDEFGPNLDNAERRDGIESTSLEAIARLRTALAFIGKRLAAADASLVTLGPVHQAASHVQSASTHVQQFTVNGSTGNLTNANAEMDSALVQIAQLNVPLGPIDLQALSEAADKYRDSLESNAKRVSAAVVTLERDSATLKDRLTELSNEITTERQRVSSIGTEFQSQFSAAQALHSTENASLQASRQEKFAELVATATESQSRQELEFTRDRQKVLDEQEDLLTALSAQYESEAGKIVTEIQRHLAEVEKLVGVIGNLGVTSGYLKTANEARITVRIWQGVAVSAMITLIVVAYRIFLPSILGTFTWEGFAGRVFFTLTIGVLAAYAASQADKFMSVERRSRTLALELEALGPYVAPLPPEKQEEFRLTIGDRTFGRDDFSGAHDNRSPATTIDLLMKSKEFRLLSTEIVKAARGN
jgi:hypothetical protein